MTGWLWVRIWKQPLCICKGKVVYNDPPLYFRIVRSPLAMGYTSVSSFFFLVIDQSSSFIFIYRLGWILVFLDLLAHLTNQTELPLALSLNPHCATYKSKTFRRAFIYLLCVLQWVFSTTAAYNHVSERGQWSRKSSI